MNAGNQSSNANLRANDRFFLNILYGLHTLAWFSGGVFAVVALIINYVRRADETQPFHRAHHDYMIATFWWTIFWLVLLSPLWLLLLVPGMLAYGVVWLWYLYRCMKGWLRFNSDRLPRDVEGTE
jgi:uncharacterized membrane protein